MYTTVVDSERNLLHISYFGKIDAAQSQACLIEVQKLLPKLAPGFCLVSDLTEMQEMELACEPFIDQLMDELNRKGVDKVVRIMPNPQTDIGLGIMSLFHYGRQVRIVTCATREEALLHIPA